MSTTERMTLTRALSDAKAVAGKLDRVLQNSSFITIAQGTGSNRKLAISQLASTNIEEVEKTILSNFQSAESLIKRYRAIKRAIVKVNAEAIVTIAGEDMTIAEAIERKKSIEMDKKFLHVLRSQLAANANALDQMTNKLNADIERGVSQLFGSDRAKITDEQVKVVGDAKKADFEPSFVDPAKLADRIDKMLDAIEQFDLEVNFSLSEVNAKTEIDVTY